MLIAYYVHRCEQQQKAVEWIEENTVASIEYDYSGFWFTNLLCASQPPPDLWPLNSVPIDYIAKVGRVTIWNGNLENKKLDELRGQLDSNDVHDLQR